MALASFRHLARHVRRSNSVGRGVAIQDEPLPAAENVLPVFPVRSLGVVKHEHEVVPGLAVGCAVRGPRLGGIATVTEFGVVALTAEWAGYSQHTVTACTSNYRCRSHRAHRLVQTGRGCNSGSTGAPHLWQSYGRGTNPRRELP